MRPRDVRAFLHDVVDACDSVLEFTEFRTFDDYLANKMLRSSVERQMTIIGEALSRAAKHAPDLVEGLPELPEIIAFRNRLVHGYDAIENDLVWAFARFRVAPLKDKVLSMTAW